MMPIVPTAQLGRTGMALSRVGIGAWAFGGAGWVDSWGPQDDTTSIAAVHRAVERGVNWIDTAPIYGLGHAESIVGRALRQLPESDRPYVFTKAGVTWDPEQPGDEPALTASARSIRTELEASLRRLRVEHIDLYQVHAPPTDGTPIEEYWQTFCDLRDEGKVRAIGLSNHDVAFLARAATVGRIDAVQPKLNLIRRDAMDLLRWCASHDIGAIVYSPMASGLLTGAFTSERIASLPDDDWRRRHPDFTAPALERNLALASSLEPVADRHGVPVATVAVAWTLAVPGVSGAIVGVRRPDQIAAWSAAASLSLDQSDLAAISDAIENTGAGTGPATFPTG